MAQLATALSVFVGRFVVDKTGLPGGYDIELTWMPDVAVSPEDRADSTGPSIFTALREELGLKVAPLTAPVQVLVVDHAEEPAAE